MARSSSAADRHLVYGLKRWWSQQRTCQILALAQGTGDRIDAPECKMRTQLSAGAECQPALARCAVNQLLVGQVCQRVPLPASDDVH